MPMDNPLLLGADSAAADDARDAKVNRLEKRVNLLTYLLGAFVVANMLLS